MIEIIILIILYILFTIGIIFNLIVGIILIRRMKEVNIYKKSKFRPIIEQKAQEEIINNWN